MNARLHRRRFANASQAPAATLTLPSFRKLRPPIQRIVALARLDFEKFMANDAALSLSETLDRCLLPFDAATRTALLARAL
jgi:hypothetical protein